MHVYPQAKKQHPPSLPKKRISYETETTQEELKNELSK